MKRFYSIAAALALSALPALASAAPIYSQDFDSMGTGTTLPTGWSGTYLAGSHDTFTPPDSSVVGVLPGEGGPAISDGTAATVTAATPTNQKASGLYNWAAGASDRSLGSSPTGTAGTVIQLQLTNNGSATTDLALDYDIRVFSLSTGNNGYNTSPYYTKEELPGYRLFYSLDGTNYTNVSALNPDGHTWANAIGTVHEHLDDLVLSQTWNTGSSLYFRWFDDNAQSSSPDQLIGLDNVVVGTAATTPEPASLALLALGGLCFLRRPWTRKA